ncbi:hypothetical protein D1007_12883 [Hordeum vulgare]|nr:hypothetical protein D1007_12883 [Hordeum vulgare]
MCAYPSGVVRLLLTGMMSSVKKNTSLCFNQSSSPSLLLVHFANGNDHANFEINTDSETIKYACKDVLQKSSKNRRHNIKKYFDTVAANKVSTKSPVPDLTDGEWQALVQMWSTPRHKKEERKCEELSVIDLFKATHNSKMHGFSEPVKIAIVSHSMLLS